MLQFVFFLCFCCFFLQRERLTSAKSWNAEKTVHVRAIFFSQEGKKINKYINKKIQAFHTPDLKININTWNFAMTICFVEHQRETRTRLWNPPPEQQFWWSKSDAAPQFITKLDTVLPLVTDKTPHNNTYYSISSCMGGMLFCNTRTVTWLAATSTAEISAADVSGQKEECVG